MTKHDLARRVAKHFNMDLSDSLLIMDAVIEELLKSLDEGHTIYLRGFGTFGLKVRKAKIGQDIRRGVAIKIDEHVVPYFKIVKEQKDRINQSYLNRKNDAAIKTATNGTSERI